MKIFKFDFGWSSGSKESSIVIAKDIERAKEVEGVNKDCFKKVSCSPKDSCESDYGITEYMVEEIPLKEGRVYTGMYCC